MIEPMENVEYQLKFFEWLDEFISEIEDPECPEYFDDFEAGYAKGSYETQKMIASKIRYAINVEKEIIENNKN
jgi:hypothetical protein